MLYIILMSISCFIIFANDLLLAVCFIFISDYGNNVRQKAKLSNVLIWVQNGLQSSETICNINNAFGAGTTNGRRVQWWFKKFYKGDESLWKLMMDGEQSLKLIFLQWHEKLPKKSTVNHSTVIWPLKQIGKVNKLNKWTHELTKNQNYHFKELCCLILHNNRFSIWLWYAMNSGFYRTISNNQLSDWSKKKPNLHTHKRLWSLFGGLLPVWSTTAF